MELAARETRDKDCLGVHLLLCELSPSSVASGRLQVGLVGLPLGILRLVPVAVAAGLTEDPGKQLCSVDDAAIAVSATVASTAIGPNFSPRGLPLF